MEAEVEAKVKSIWDTESMTIAELLTAMEKAKVKQKYPFQWLTDILTSTWFTQAKNIVTVISSGYKAYDSISKLNFYYFLAGD